MTYRLTWLADAVRAEGVKVIEEPGWKSHGRREIKPLRGIICHHTAGPRSGDHPSLGTIIRGRSDLSGPLAQFLLSRCGDAYVCAAGVANHGGAGVWPFPKAGIPRNQANNYTVGIEWENVGQDKFNVEPIQPAAYDSYVKICAAICKHEKLDPMIAVVGHREYAPKRKSDPCRSQINMDVLRADVKKCMEGTYVTRVGEVGKAVPAA